MEIDAAILKAVEDTAVEKRLTCTQARGLAEELKVTPKLIGEAANKLEIKIKSCELGCF